MPADESEDLVHSLPEAVRRLDVALADAEIALESQAAGPRVPTEPKVIEPVPIILDRPRTLRMSFRAMKRFHQVTGLSAWAREVWNNPTPDIMITLIWAGLLHEDPDLQLDDVWDMPGLDMGNIAYITDRIGELWGRTMPDADQEANAEGDAVPNLPSPQSSRNGSTTGRSPESTSASATPSSGISPLESTEHSSTEHDMPTSFPTSEQGS